MAFKTPGDFKVQMNLELLGSLSLGLAQRSVQVGEHTTGGDGHLTQELGELLVVADGQLDVAGDDSGLLVVAGSVTGELEDLSDEVLEDGSHVDGGTSTDASRVASLLQVTSNTTNGELESSFCAAGLTGTRLLSDLTATTFTFTRHIERNYFLVGSRLRRHGYSDLISIAENFLDVLAEKKIDLY